MAENNMPTLEFAVFDEFGVGADDRVRDYASKCVSASVDSLKLTADDVRAAGGIVHSDGNIFFTNIDKLNAAVRAAASLALHREGGGE